MTAIDPKVQKIAREIMERGEGLGCAIKAAIDAADLVPRRDANAVSHIVDEALFHLEAERDEARRKVDELARALRQEKAEVELQLALVETQGQQLAALRACLAKAIRVYGKDDILRPELLTDTAQAAALYQRVPEWRDIKTAPVDMVSPSGRAEDADPWIDWCLLWIPDKHGGLPIVGGMDAGTWLYRDEERRCGEIQTPPTHYMPIPAAPQAGREAIEDEEG